MPGARPIDHSSPKFLDLEMGRVRADQARERAEMQQAQGRAMMRPLVTPEDKPMFIPELLEMFTELDQVVAASAKSEKYATMYRLGSIGAHRHQMDFYFRAATSPAVRTICEVGFNAGHSTAVYLAANPVAAVHSFDLFRANYSIRTLMHMQRRFPGRIVPHAGDSTRSIPATALSPPCDLVHVDGRHSYLNVVQDFVNLLVKSRRGALFLFDDQCDAANCTALWPWAGQPALAACDLEAAGLLERVAASYAGPRQFSMYRAPDGAHGAAAALLRAAGPVDGRRTPVLLPCSRPCSVQWTGINAGHQTSWERHHLPSLRQQQQQFRPADCKAASASETAR